MKHLLVTLSLSLFMFPVLAQSVPDARAQRINSQAVSVYMRYGSSADSVLSAIQLLDKAITIDNKYLAAWSNKLAFECRLQRYTDAMQTARKISAIFPEQADIVFLRGVLELKTGQNTAAATTFGNLVRYYDEAGDTLSTTGHLMTAQLNKGLALKLMGRTAESQAILTKLSNREHDPAVKKHITAYIAKSKEELISDMIANTIQ